MDRFSQSGRRRPPGLFAWLRPLGLLLAAMFWGMSCAGASAQELPSGAPVGLEPGVYLTVEQSAPDGWRIVEHGPAGAAEASSMERFTTAPKGAMGTPRPGGAGLVGGPKDALRFIFERRDGGMFLTVSNGYDKRLIYEAAIQQSPGSRPARTSICPVLPHQLTIETWPYEISLITLGRFQLVEDDQAPLICK